MTSEAEPLAHIARDPLPWRDPTDTDTECGKPASQFAKVIPAEEAVAMWRRLGAQRASLFLCMTCKDSLNRWGRSLGPTYVLPTFANKPLERFNRETGKRAEQLDIELRALGELVTRHRQEFEDLVSGRVVPIAEVQRKAAGVTKLPSRHRALSTHAKSRREHQSPSESTGRP